MNATNLTNELEMRELFEAKKREFASHTRYLAALTALGINPKFDKVPVVLDFFPDGGCDFIRLLVNGEYIVTMDFPWAENEPIEVLDHTPLQNYLVGKTRIHQNKVALAKEFGLS